MPLSGTRVRRGEPENQKRRWMRVLLLFFALLIAPLVIWMIIESKIVNLIVTDVWLGRLPREFDGVKILFVSDLHMDIYASPERTMALMSEFQALEPDILILGGDYTHFSRFGGAQAELKRRDTFFELMAGFRAPMGKYGVAGNHDTDPSNKLLIDAPLGVAMARGGVTLLKNSAVTLERRGASITLAGLDDWIFGNKDLRGVAERAGAAGCVILVSHSPDALPKLSAETAEYGNWVDLMLTGHTHGGQLTLFGFKMLMKSSVYGERYQSGWYNEYGVKMLVSNGVGSVFLPLRLCAPAQAHLLTLRSGANIAGMTR